MQKTFINFYKNEESELGLLCGFKEKSLEDSLEHVVKKSTSEYLFTLEINENGEPRTFKHELPKEPVKKVFNFFSDKKGNMIVGHDYEGFGDEVFLFKKCFDETGKEYPIEGEECLGVSPASSLVKEIKSLNKKVEEVLNKIEEE